MRVLRELRAAQTLDFLTYVKILSRQDLSGRLERRKPLRCPEPFEL